MFKILASEVSAPAAAASERLFSDPEISLKKSGSWRFNTWLVSSQQATRTYPGSGTVNNCMFMNSASEACHFQLPRELSNFFLFVSILIAEQKMSLLSGSSVWLSARIETSKVKIKMLKNSRMESALSSFIHIRVKRKF
jgi:hypothetical protein